MVIKLSWFPFLLESQWILYIFLKMYHFFQDIFICGQRNLHDICLVFKEMSVYFDFILFLSLVFLVSFPLICIYERFVFFQKLVVLFSYSL